MKPDGGERPASIIMARQTIKQLEKEVSIWKGMYEASSEDYDYLVLKQNRLRNYLTNFKTEWGIFWFLAGAWAASFIIFILAVL